jgi:hypothetical protein
MTRNRLVTGLSGPALSVVPTNNPLEEATGTTGSYNYETGTLILFCSINHFSILLELSGEA